MKPTTLKLALGGAALGALSLFATSQVQAQPSAPGDSFQNKPSVESFSMVMQSRGRLGAKVITMSEDLRSYFGAPADRGLLIDSVADDSPASKAGLKSGDVIVAVEGNAISEAWDIMQAMSGAKKGDSVKLEIVRDKKQRTLSATLDSEAIDGQWSQGPGGPNFGFDFGKGNNFGKGNKGFAPEFFGKRFPFANDLFEPGDLQEKVRRLEERLNKLEGKPAPGKSAPKSAPSQPFKSGRTGASS